MLANEFRARMIILDLNQSQLAAELDVSTRTVKRWLNETVIPKLAILALETLERRKGIKL